MKGLTERQKEVLNIIVRFQNRFERPPSLSDLQEELDINTPRGVVSHLDALEKKGYIRRDSTARSIKILETADEEIEKEFIFLPLLGEIIAGAPNLAEEFIEDYIPVPTSIVGGRRDSFLLKVYGNSMNKAHILKGDMVVVQPGEEVFAGDIVVALMNNDATLKRLRSKDGDLYLTPESTDSSHKEMKVDSEFIIQGKVISVIRNLE